MTHPDHNPDKRDKSCKQNKCVNASIFCPRNPSNNFFGTRNNEIKRASPCFDPTGDRGFTLIEIVIAVFLIVTALVGLTSTTVIAIKGNSFSKMMTTATTLAQDKMEVLKNRSFANISSGGPEIVQTSYTRSWAVTDGSPTANIKTIGVTVAWSWQGTSHSVILNSMVGN